MNARERGSGRKFLDPWVQNATFQSLELTQGSLLTQQMSHTHTAQIFNGKLPQLGRVVALEVPCGPWETYHKSLEGRNRSQEFFVVWMCLLGQNENLELVLESEKEQEQKADHTTPRPKVEFRKIGNLVCWPSFRT